MTDCPYTTHYGGRIRQMTRIQFFFWAVFAIVVLIVFSLLINESVKAAKEANQAVNRLNTTILALALAGAEIRLAQTELKADIAAFKRAQLWYAREVK